jgi:hypothetical protein
MLPWRRNAIMRGQACYSTRFRKSSRFRVRSDAVCLQGGEACVFQTFAGPCCSSGWTVSPSYVPHAYIFAFMSCMKSHRLEACHFMDRLDGHLTCQRLQKLRMQLITPGGAGNSKDSDVPLKSNPASPTGMGIDIPLNQQSKSKPQEKEGDPEVILAGMHACRPGRHHLCHARCVGPSLFLFLRRISFIRRS